MSRTLLCTRDNGGEFRVTVPDDARITFGPFSPPTKDRDYDRNEKLRGTLRVYRANSTTDILAVFAGVASFRDTSVIGFAQKIAVEEGATLWKDDQEGYSREHKVNRKEEWIADDPAPRLLPKQRNRKEKSL